MIWEEYLGLEGFKSLHYSLLHAGSQTSWQIASLPATEAVEQLCSRKLTALQYAEAVIEIAETYTCLNIFSFLDKEKVRPCFTKVNCWAVMSLPCASSLKKPLCRGHCQFIPPWIACLHVQVLAEAKAVDALHAKGEDIKPLCGLAFAVKDNIDVLGCAPPTNNLQVLAM